MTVEAGKDREKGRVAFLKEYHALNPDPERVKDKTFLSGAPFFDPEDLMQVKYEMLRSVEQDNRSVTDAAGSFGFSRPSFYHAKQAFEEGGLAGLLPERPGPKRAHKLDDEVMEYVEELLKEKGPLNSKALAAVIREEFGISVHPRSVERALSRRNRNG